jgi:hypothetical protein
VLEVLKMDEEKSRRRSREVEIGVATVAGGAASCPARSAWLVCGLLLWRNEFKMVDKDASEAVLRSTALVAAAKGRAAIVIGFKRN